MTHATDATAPLPFQRTAATRDVLRYLLRQKPGLWTFGAAAADETGLAPTTVKDILARLAAQRWCDSREEAAQEARRRALAMPGRLGRHTAARRYYRLTPKGRAALARQEVQEWLAKG